MQDDHAGARQARRQYRGQMSRRLLVQYFLSLFSAAVGLGLLAVLLWPAAGQLLRQLSGQPGDLRYRLLYWCREYILLVGGGALLLLWTGITYYFFNRPLRDLDELIAAAERLAAPGAQPVVLPPSMKNVEDQLNLVRERALRDAAAAREAEQRKNDLIVYLAHDLRTPLTSVIGYLTLLRDEPQLPPDTRARHTGIALDKAVRLEDLICEFFEITRFNLSRIELETAPVDLTRMLEQVSSEFAPMLREKSLQCRLTLPPTLLCTCDADKLARVFENLLRNAVHYSLPGGTVDICAVQSPDGLTLTFANEGKTIPPDKLDRLFEQFFRLDGARQSHTGGAGLGLAIAREMVEAHGGTIAAESADGRVVFRVTLPPQENRKVSV